MYKLFVLDFDGTYDNEEQDDYGVVPSVYLIKNRKDETIGQTMLDVIYYAYKAGELFFERDGDCIGDIFEELLRENKIKFKLVGSLDILFSERQTDYLADGIEFVYV